MEQHLIVFDLKNLHFSKSNFSRTARAFSLIPNIVVEIEKEIVNNLEDLEVFDKENAVVDRKQQVFEFVETPSLSPCSLGAK